jgi:O-antigen/teichoic acid export membrane protein/SAM-dependent methyltransferase
MDADAVQSGELRTEEVLGVAERVRLMRDGVVNNSRFFVAGLTGLILVPIMLKGLGAEAYGLWIAALSLAGILWGFTPNFSWSVAREVAAARESPQEVVPFVLSAGSASIAVGLLGSAIVCAAGFFIGQALRLSPSALGIAPSVFALVAVENVFDRLCLFEMDILYGLRRFDVINLIGISAALLQSGGIAGLICAGRGLVSVAAWCAVVSASIAYMSVRFVARVEPRLRLRPAGIGWAALRQQIPFSVTSQLLEAAGTAAWQAPPLAIGLLLGSASIVPYQVGQKFPLAVAGISGRAAEVLFPASSEQGKDSAPSRIYEILQLGVRWNVVLALPLCLVLWVVAPSLLHAWLSHVPPGSIAILRLMTAAVLVNAVGIGAWHVLWGRGAARRVLIIHCGVALTSLGLTLALLRHTGVVGAAWGLLLAMGLGVAAFLHSASRAYAFRTREMMARITSGLLIPVLLCFAFSLSVSRLAGPGWVGITVTALAGALGYVAGFCLGHARAEEVLFMRSLFTVPSSAASSSYRRLRGILRRVGFLRSVWHFMLAVKDALRDSSARQRAELNREFERSVDPWDYATNPLERQRHRREAEMLDAVRGGEKFEDALEVGCAEGIFTEILAERCESLFAVDISPVALARARARRAWDDRVRFAEWDLRVDPLPGTYDLIVVVHTLELLQNPLALRRARAKLVEGLRPGGYLLVGCTGDYDSPAAQAWWGRYLLRGGQRINGFIAQHPALRVISTTVSPVPRSVSHDVLLQKVM